MAAQVINWESKSSSQFTRLEVSNSSCVQWQYEENCDFHEANLQTYGWLNGINAGEHVDLCGRYIAYLKPLSHANDLQADENELRFAVLDAKEGIRDLGVCSVPGEKVLSIKLLLKENPHILVHFQKSVAILRLFPDEFAHLNGKSFNFWVDSMLATDAETQSPLGMVLLIDLKFTVDTAPLEVYWHPQDNWEFITCHRNFAAQWAVKNLLTGNRSKKFAAESDIKESAQAAPYHALSRLIKAICLASTEKEPKCAMTAVGDNALLFVLMNPNFLGVYADDATHEIGRPHLKGFVELDHEWYKCVNLTKVIVASKPVDIDSSPISATALLHGANLKKTTKSIVPEIENDSALNMALAWQKDGNCGFIFFRAILQGLTNGPGADDKDDTRAPLDRSKENIWISEPLLNLKLGPRESFVNYLNGTFVISVSPGPGESVPGLINVKLGDKHHLLTHTPLECEIMEIEPLAKIPADTSNNKPVQMVLNIAGRIPRGRQASVISKHNIRKCEVDANSENLLWIRTLTLPCESLEANLEKPLDAGRSDIETQSRKSDSISQDKQIKTETKFEESAQLDLSTPSESPQKFEAPGSMDSVEVLPPGFSGRLRPSAVSGSPTNPFSSHPINSTNTTSDADGHDSNAEATVESLASLLADRVGARILELVESKKTQIVETISSVPSYTVPDTHTYNLSELDKVDLSGRFAIAMKPLQSDVESATKGLLSSSTFLDAHNKLELHLEQTMQQVVKVSMQSLTQYMKNFVKESIVPSFVQTIEDVMNEKMERIRKEVLELSQNERVCGLDSHEEGNRRRLDSQGNGNAIDASDITTNVVEDLKGQIEALKEDLFVSHAKQLATVQAETIQRVQAYILTHVTKPFTAKLDDLKEDLEGQLAPLMNDTGDALNKNMKYHDKESLESILIDIRNQMKRQSQSLTSIFTSAIQRLADKISTLKADTDNLKGILGNDDKGLPSRIFTYDATGLGIKRPRPPTGSVNNVSGPGMGGGCLPASSSLMGEDTQSVRCMDCAASFRHGFHCCHDPMALQPACSVPLAGQCQPSQERSLNQSQSMRLRPRSVYRAQPNPTPVHYYMGNRETDLFDDGSIVSRRAFGNGNQSKWSSEEKEIGLDAKLSKINLSHIATASPDDSGDGAFAEDLLNKIAEEQYDVCMYKAAQRDTEEGTGGFWTLLSSRHFEPVAVGLRRGGAILVGAAKLIVDGLLLVVGGNGSYLTSSCDSKNVTVAISNGITMNIPKGCIVANPDTIISRLNWLRSVLAVVDVNQANLEPTELMEYKRHLEQGLIRFLRSFPASGRMAGSRGIVQRHVHALLELLNGRFAGDYSSQSQTAGQLGSLDPPSIVF